MVKCRDRERLLCSMVATMKSL